MKPGLKPGISIEFVIAVTPEMCPHFDGQLVHRLYSTWSLVHHFELAGRRILIPYLDDHEEAVGGGIHVEHRSPAIVGSLVRISAVVQSFDGRDLWCETAAHCRTRLLAIGRFLQVILRKEKLAALMKRCERDIEANSSG